MKKVSIILIDWSVRESFHAINYLNKQTFPRENYEIIWIEYYSRRPKALEEYQNQGKLDKWLVLNRTGMYFKHLMFNEGIVAACGEIIVIPDSDAVFSPTFLESIVSTFDQHHDDNILLYLDEVRNENISFYPFRNDVAWETIMSTPPLANWDNVAQKPRGLTTEHDIIHRRNYGACLCATRKSLIEIGGFGEHPVYHAFLGCVYEGGWRLVNKGYREIWHQTEWLLHCWHPWVKAGVEAMGPDDGRLINLTALEARKTGRVLPLVENEKIRQLRTGAAGVAAENLEKDQIDIVHYQPIRNKSTSARDIIHLLKLTARFFLSPNRANRILLATDSTYEAGLKKTTYRALLDKPMQFGNRAAWVRTFYYDLQYHAVGKQKMWDRLLKTCQWFKPELVVLIPQKNTPDVFSTEIVEPPREAISHITNELGIKVYIYDTCPDNCHRHDDWLGCASYLGITYPLPRPDKLAGNPKVIQGYPAVSPIYFYNQRRERDIDVCFWGSVPVGRKREECINFLRDNGVKVWTRLYKVSAEDYAWILNRSKIALSISNDNEKGGLRKRSFEIMACKALLIEDDTVATAGLFEAGKDFVLFRDKEDLLEKVRYYLHHDEERKSIAQAGNARVTGTCNAENMWQAVFAAMGFRRAKLWAGIWKLAYFGWDFMVRISRRVRSPQFVASVTRSVNNLVRLSPSFLRPSLTKLATFTRERIRRLLRSA